MYLLWLLAPHGAQLPSSCASSLALSTSGVSISTFLLVKYLLKQVNRAPLIWSASLPSLSGIPVTLTRRHHRHSPPPPSVYACLFRAK